jgi:pyruvate dehydrogenase E2 component (dihydrolipoamide acetyltransferase)
MARSKREVPHYYLRTTIDLGRVRAWLDRANEGRPPAERILPAAVLLWAVARAAAAVPGINGHWLAGGFRPADAVRLGVAISLRGGGLVAPAVADTDQMDAETLMGRLRDLTDRARHGRLRASDMADPSITVTNLGDTGVEEVFGVIYPPQVAMVGLGRVVERPWAVDGAVMVRPVVTVSLSGDHRASNGHGGARFLSTIDRLLQDAEEPWSATEPTT